MSFLAPLYFLGALAVAGPIIFHLIRRQPKGEVEFSSLMFLDSTPPRLTRRSRLENWPLLLLRCAAIVFLAFAFARPFLPLAESDSVEGVKQAVVVLIDQSASMKRTGLWQQATQKAEQILADCDDEAIVSVIAFDSSPRNLLSLEESINLPASARKSAATDAIDSLSPTWQATDAGKAIRFAADQAALLEIGDADRTDSMPNSLDKSAAIETQIVLLSDLQSGAELESLQGYEWPERVWLNIETLTATTRGNASLRVVPQPIVAGIDEESREANRDTVRVQVSHSDDGNSTTFRLRFDDQQTDAAVVQVPPGQTRFFTVPLPVNPVGDQADAGGVDTTVDTATLNVIGDSDPFDNAFHFIRPKRIRQEVRFVQPRRLSESTVASVRETLSFYTTQLPWSDSTRDVQLNVTDDSSWHDNVDPSTTPLLIFQATESIGEHVDVLKGFLAGGGRALIVLDRSAADSAGGGGGAMMQSTLSQVLDSPDLVINESDESEYTLISSVDFRSSLIAPLSDPGINDFSNIRIWKHRELEGLSEDAKVLLKLDDGFPLLIQKDFKDEDDQTPDGRLWILSTGWQPSQSQFALSTKFVPIMLGMLGPNRNLAPESRIVGDLLAQNLGEQSGDETRATEPGFVELDDGSRIAINLDPRESDTTAADLDRITQYGAVVSSPAAREQQQTAERALRDVELESRQGWWQWLILATLGFIAAETLLAAKDRPMEGAQG